MDLAIDPGRLRHKVNIQEVTETRTDAGDTTESWQTVESALCEFMSSTGREFYRAKQLNADMTHLLRMHFTSTLTTDHRLVFETRNLNVESIENVDEQDLVMLVTCKEAK